MKTLYKLQTYATAAVMLAALAAPAAFAQSSSTVSGGDTTPEATGAKAHQSGERHNFHRHNMIQAMTKKLGLTDAQVAQAKQIRDSHRETLAGLRNQMRAKREEIRESEKTGTFNEALVNQKLTEIAGIQTKLMGEEFQMRQQFLALLTPEQKTKLDQMRAEFKAKHAERRAPQA